MSHRHELYFLCARYMYTFPFTITTLYYRHCAQTMFIYLILTQPPCLIDTNSTFCVRDTRIHFLLRSLPCIIDTSFLLSSCHQTLSQPCTQHPPSPSSTSPFVIETSLSSSRTTYQSHHSDSCTQSGHWTTRNQIYTHHVHLYNNEFEQNLLCWLAPSMTERLIGSPRLKTFSYLSSCYTLTHPLNYIDLFAILCRTLMQPYRYIFEKMHVFFENFVLSRQGNE